MIRCVITNDDGVDAPGLRALYAALRGLADVLVVAPAAEWSTRGHNAPSREPIRVERRECADMGDVFVVHAQPADCVRLAFAELAGPHPDVVVSGINHGGNCGVDLYYSGTVAAAREAAILGCPAIAISQLVRKGLAVDWGESTARARVILQRLFGESPHGGPARLWNVNLPHLPPGQRPKGIVRAPMATTPLEIVYEQAGPPSLQAAGASGVYRYTGSYFRRPAPSGTDVAYLFGDWVTITELTTDLTNASCVCAEGEYVE